MKSKQEEANILDEVFRTASEAIRVFFMGNIEQSVRILQERKHLHCFYDVIRLGLEVTALTDLDQGNIVSMIERLDTAINQLEGIRHRRPWLSPCDYNKFSDEESLVEVFIATAYCMKAMNLILDGSYMCYIKASLLMRKSYVTFMECRKLFQERKTWNSIRSKDEFECFMRMGCGLFECGISFIHPQFMWVLQLLGYSGNRRYALDQIRMAAELNTSIKGFPMMAVLMSHLLIRPMLDPLIEPDEKLIDRSLNFIDNYLRGGVFSDLSRVIVESRTGDIKLIKPYLVKATSIVYPMGYLNKYMHLLNLMAAICEEDWSAAIDAITSLEQSKYTPAFACYTRGCILMHQLHTTKEPSERKSLINQMVHVFQQVPKKKRSLGGSKTFHKQYILKNAERFASQPEIKAFPLYEMLGLFSFLKIVPLLPQYVSNALNLVTEAIEGASNNISTDERVSLLYCRATLINSEADPTVEQLLTEISETDCTYNVHLQAQANYELGIMKYKCGETEEARTHFKRARGCKGHSLSELIDYRVALCLDSMNRSNCKMRRRGSLDDVLPAIFA